jgi:hypothetical protein
MRRSPEQHVDPPPCPPTRKQQAFLARNRIDPGRALDFYEAAHAIGRFVRSRHPLSLTVRLDPRRDVPGSAALLKDPTNATLGTTPVVLL